MCAQLVALVKPTWWNLKNQGSQSQTRGGWGHRTTCQRSSRCWLIQAPLDGIASEEEERRESVEKTPQRRRGKSQVVEKRWMEEAITI